MSVDPDNGGASDVDPQSWNGYAYSRNNPVNLTDPSGRDYRVCIDNGNGGYNCALYKHDADFENAARDSGVTFSNGKVYASTGEEIGSYVHFDEGIKDISTDYLNLYYFGQAAKGLFSLGRLAFRGVADLLAGGAEEAVDLSVMVKPNPAEAAMIQELRQAGLDVQQLPRTAGKSADLLVNGIKTELKTLTGEGPNTLKNAIETAAEQGDHILIDARNVEHYSRTSCQSDCSSAREYWWPRRSRDRAHEGRGSQILTRYLICTQGSSWD